MLPFQTSPKVHPFLVIRLFTLQLYFLSLLVLPMSVLGDKSLAASDLLDEFNDYEVLTKGRLRWRLAVASYLRQ